MKPIYKKFLSLIFLSALFMTAGETAFASKPSNGYIAELPVTDATMTRVGDVMNVAMNLEFSNYKLKGNKAVLFTPYIVNGNDSLELTPVAVYSRGRWYYYQRKEQLLGAPDALALRYSKHMDNIGVAEEVKYQPWMDGSHLAVKSETFACANCLADEEILNLDARYREFHPSFLFGGVEEILAVEDVVKTRELSGRAFIDFPVNQTVIYPDYRNNTVELAKIIATIDSVKNDKDVTVNSLSIKGFASPEGSYENNIRLAKGRTEALKTYVQQLYKFPAGFIKTSYEPEDWEGLRDWVVNSNIDNKAGILAIIDSDLAPDPKNTKIQTTYPEQYRFLLANVYPALRHSDYRIEYTIRQFTEIKDIEEVIRTQPAKLTYKEMMTLADKYTPGSDEYNDVFEIAVRMFPDEPVANLNVANSALMRGDLVTAVRYLPKAGNSAEAVLARANYAFLTGDYQTAGELYSQAAQTLPEAQVLYEQFLEAGY